MVASPKLQDGARTERQGWSLIASLWVHALLFATLPYCGSMVAPTTRAVDARLTLLRPLDTMTTDPAKSGADQAATAPLGAGARDREERATVAGAAKALASTVDPSRAADVGQENDQAKPAPRKTGAPASEPRERAARDAKTAPPPPRELEAEPSPPSERPDRAEEPEPEVVVAEAERADHERWLDFVRNSDDARDVTPDSATHLSNRSSSTDLETRALTHAAALAKTPTPDTSQRQDPAAPTLHEADGTPSDPSGSRPSPIPSQAVGTIAGGGGHRAIGEASRAAGAAGVAIHGGQAAPPGVASEQADAPSDRAPLERSASSSQGERPLPHDDAPSWWHPTAFLATTEGAADAVEAAPKPSPPSPTRATRHAPVPTTQPISERGGNGGEVEHLAAAGEPPSEQPGEDDPQLDAGVSDPVQSLRDALGWGGIDRSALAPRAAVSGTSTGAGEPNAASTVALNDKFFLDDNMFINAEGTALGAYIARMDDGIHEAWEQIDLATHDKGIGVTGNVTVYFRVQPSGKVADVQLLASSGNASIDRKALLAIPKRVDRRPDDVDLSGDLHRKITFVYQDAIALGGGR